ncbi:Nucleoporin NUP188, partial [Linum perenne]
LKPPNSICNLEAVCVCSKNPPIKTPQSAKKFQLHFSSAPPSSIAVRCTTSRVSATSGSQSSSSFSLPLLGTMSSNQKSVDSSLWWDSFSSLLAELENAEPSSDLPPHLATKLKQNHGWFVETVSRFKPPNSGSKEALNAEKLKIGEHELSVKPQLREKALQISSCSSLDEVQSYIIVERSLEHNGLSIDSIAEEYLHLVLLDYYIERQCLLKCTRQILMHSLSIGIRSKGENLVRDEALKLISDGLEHKLVAVLQDLLSVSHPTQMDIDLVSLWAEETLIEDNLVLDILFLVYYESLCICNGEMWRMICSLYKGIISGSYNFEKLSISTEAGKSCYQAKVQLLIILIETLDLENLLQLVHDETPFRNGISSFTYDDIQQMDALISDLTATEEKEVAGLLFAWAVFLCLVSSLPAEEQSSMITDIDHVSYVRQAFDGAALSYFLEIMGSDMLQDSDGPVAGYRSVLRTTISAFIASYEINLQLEDGNLGLIVDILCKIYHGEESLCVQFWDRESFIDGPLRCLLCNLEGEFPFRTIELIRLLSSLSEGSWPAECVYNFLDKSVGISSLFEVTSESIVDRVSQIVETQQSLPVPGIEGLIVPSKTRGQVLKVVDAKTALVRWEYTQSGLLILLLRLAQSLQCESNKERFLILDLLRRMVSFNTAVTFSLMEVGNSFYQTAAGLSGQVEKNSWMVEIICAVIRNSSASSEGAVQMSIGVSILAEMIKGAPTLAALTVKANIFEMASRTSMFDLGYNSSSSESWLPSGKLAKMLQIDSELNDYDIPLVISVLEFTIGLVERRIENDLVLALVAFCLQYVLVNHDSWKYKVKQVQWRVTLKVLDLTKTCITAVPYLEKLGIIIRDMLLWDSSIHSTIFRLVCNTKETLEKLYVSRLFELTEIEGFQLAIGSALDVLHLMLYEFSKLVLLDFMCYHTSLHLTLVTCQCSVYFFIGCLFSLLFLQSIQVGAARVLAMLLITTEYLRPHMSGNVWFILDDHQIADLKQIFGSGLSDLLERNEDLFISFMNVLTSAACYKPSFLIAMFSPTDIKEVKLGDSVDAKGPTEKTSNGALESKKASLADGLMTYVESSNDLIMSNPRVLLSFLHFMKALWQGGAHYISIMDSLKISGKFWTLLCSCISSVAASKDVSLEKLSATEAQSLAYKYKCQSAILEIMACDMFLFKKLLHAESLLKEASQIDKKYKNVLSSEISKSDRVGARDIWSSWCEKSILGSLIKMYTSCEYENGIFYHTKVASSLFSVHAMGKFAKGDMGSFSISLLEKIGRDFKNLCSQPAFADLMVQYSHHGYSEGHELNVLILNDLYYHLQGELEGRRIGPGPFKELSQYLAQSNSLQSCKREYDNEPLASTKEVYLYDVKCIKKDLGLDLWNYTSWKASKDVVDAMLDYMDEANSMLLVLSSKLSALRELTTVFTIFFDNSLKKDNTRGMFSNQLCVSCIDHICKHIHDAISLVASSEDSSREVLDLVEAQAELLLCLVRFVKSQLPLSTCILALKTSGSGLKVLLDSNSYLASPTKTTTLLVMVLLSTLEFCETSDTGTETVGLANICMGLLPILCKCITGADHSSISLTTSDLILRCFLTPNTWLPLIQEHLQLRHVILNLQDGKSSSAIPTTLRFLLTLARVRAGAEMLLGSGFLSSLRVLFTNYCDGRHIVKSSDKTEKPQEIWGIGLAVVTAMIHSLGDGPACNDIVNDLVPYIFEEKAYVISHYLSAPENPDVNGKKRPRELNPPTSLLALKETEHTLALMCILAKRRRTWVKATKEVDTQFREKSIHLLAFISRGGHRSGESATKSSLLACPPMLKQDFQYTEKAPFVNSKHGWFALSPHCCGATNSKLHPPASESSSTALIVKGQPSGISNGPAPTFFSDLVAVQMYRIAFLVLKFLCIEAKGAAGRSEELGFVDLAHIPELPMPEILHGLQDQAVAIICDICATNAADHELQSISLILIQILEMALYLELSVLQICGIRPVLGRVDDFSKGAKQLFKVMEGQGFLNPSTKSLKQIVSLVYPGLL